MNYLCERATGPEKSCDFRSGKVILQQPIERAQMEKLLNEGRTDVLRGFISNRTRRKFAAFLVRKPDGSVGFEFEQRVKTPARKGRARDRRCRRPRPLRPGGPRRVPPRPPPPVQQHVVRSKKAAKIGRPDYAESAGKERCQGGAQDRKDHTRIARPGSP